VGNVQPTGSDQHAVLCGHLLCLRGVDITTVRRTELANALWTLARSGRGRCWVPVPSASCMGMYCVPLDNSYICIQEYVILVLWSQVGEAIRCLLCTGSTIRGQGCHHEEDRQHIGWSSCSPRFSQETAHKQHRRCITVLQNYLWLL
jgi:hypothetical protein